MATLKNHPGFWLRDDAASAFDRAEDDHGVFGVNSAGRLESEQQGLLNRWNAGGTSNRPPYLYKPANPASTSNHVRNGGAAIDTSDWRRFATVCENYGFRHTYPDGDVVHFDYIGGGSSNTPVQFEQVVADRQNYLNATFNAGLEVDGRNGPKTNAAIAVYQDVLGVATDGVWGGNTQAAHDTYWADHHQPAQTPASGGTSTADFGRVDVVQQALKTKYPLYAGNLVVDNIDGPATQAAVSEFQRRAGLVVDGVAGPATRGALGV